MPWRLQSTEQQVKATCHGRVIVRQHIQPWSDGEKRCQSWQEEQRPGWEGWRQRVGGATGQNCKSQQSNQASDELAGACCKQQAKKSQLNIKLKCWKKSYKSIMIAHLLFNNPIWYFMSWAKLNWANKFLQYQKTLYLWEQEEVFFFFFPVLLRYLFSCFTFFIRLTDGQ